MPSANTQRFIEALKQTEIEQDASILAAIFAEKAELSNLGASASDPKAFWTDYLAMFDTIASEFTLVAEVDNRAVLEWESKGKIRGGKPIDYRGVSVLEWEGDRIRKFRTYYDTAPFVRTTSTE